MSVSVYHEDALTCKSETPEMTAIAESPLARRVAARRRPSAKAYANRAAALAEAGGYAAAEAAYRCAIAIEPTASRWYGLAGAIRGRGVDRLDEVATACRETIGLDATFAEAYGTLAMVLGAQWEAGGDWPLIDEAIGHAWQAYRMTESAEYLIHYTLLLQLAGRYQRAQSIWDAILAKGIAEPIHRVMRSMIALIRGEYLTGFSEYQQMFEPGVDDAKYPPREFRWNGQPTDRTITICATHGYGDNFQFLRYAPLVRERCGRVVVAAFESSAHHHAASLFAGFPGVDAVVTSPGDAPTDGYWAPTGALPHIFGTTLATIPPPSITIDRAAIERWRPIVESIPGFRVGVVWRGDAKNRTDPRRSYDPALLAPLAAIPGVSLVALQFGRDDEIGDLPIAPIVGRVDWLDTAAVIAGLDLVITCETGLAHLAGTIGVPTWIPLNDPPDWRWLIGRDESPWYPSIRLFRQAPRGGWDDVFRRIEGALRDRVSQVSLHQRGVTWQD